MKNIRWDDMVFTNRNQSYGAYVLRKAYGDRVTLSFGVAIMIFTLILFSPTIKAMFIKDVVVVNDKVSDREILVDINPPPIELIEPEHNIKPVDVAKLRFVPPKPTDLNVTEDIPTIKDLHNAVVSDQSTDGEVTFTDEPAAEISLVDEGEDNTIRMFAEQQPEFPGGYAEMMKFISKHIKYPSSARRMGIEGSIFVSFVVNKDGTIESIQLAKGIYADLDNEAMRVISRMPAWKPGKQNGKAVNVRFVLPIKFKMD